MLLAIGQSWWYGHPGDRFYGEPSPRSFVQEILSLPEVDRSRLATYEFSTPMVDYYVGERVKSFDAGGHATLLDLSTELAVSDRPIIRLIRKTQPREPEVDPRPAIERLRQAGLE